MKELQDFLQELFGTSWRTTTYGLMLILIGILLIAVGKIFNMGEVTVGGGGAIATGLLALMTRDNRASEQAVRKIDQQIANTQRTSAMDHQESLTKIANVQAEVVEVATDVAKGTAAAVAERTVTEELRKGP